MQGKLDLERLNQSLVGRQSYPIQDHYQFIAQPMSIEDEEGSRVLMIRTVPLENLSESDEAKRQQWRYLIYKNSTGDILTARLSEEKVQAMLKSAGVTITPKPGLPAVETDERIPEREPKPQPNPNDAEFLKQHPELDPERTGKRMPEGVPPPSFTPSPEPPKSQPSAPVTMTQAPAVEAGPNWFLILVVLLVAIGAGVVLFRFFSKPS